MKVDDRIGSHTRRVISLTLPMRLVRVYASLFGTVIRRLAAHSSSNVAIADQSIERAPARENSCNDSLHSVRFGDDRFDRVLLLVQNVS